MDSRSTKFIQMMTRLTFDIFTARSNLRPHAFVWGNVEKSFSQNVWKTYGGNLQCVIKVVKHFSYNQYFVP